MQAAETELKFFVDDIPAFHRMVAAEGLALRTPRTLETNTLFDTPNRTLRARRQILRLRQYGPRCVLTHKRTVEGVHDVRYKTRIETETDVEDCKAMAEVFDQLGYGPVFRYEKYRTEWDADGGGHLVLDETPIGVWAELEGDTGWIDTMLDRLRVDPRQCTTESYGSLFLHWKERTGSPAENLCFDEIAPATV